MKTPLFALSLLVFSTSLAQAASPAVNKVPPKGVASLDAKGLSYYKELGPLQFAARQLPTPSYPTLRVNFALNAVLKDQVLSGYKVEVERVNLSPLLYKDVVEEYGKENADASLNNKTPSDHYTLPYAIVQSITAEPLLKDIKIGKSQAKGKACGLQKDCAAMWVDDEGAWTPIKTVTLERAPWEKSIHYPAAMIRALAQNTNWLQQHNKEWQWVTPELPEGLSAKRPWVEVTIDNYTGNGGMWAADWAERVMDDSVDRKLTRLIIGDGEKTGTIYRAYLCQRPKSDKPQKRCKEI
jgi:hypothetical protein